MLKKTPLAATHEKMGAKMIDFAGWYMPVYYTNVIDEHNTVRQKVGLFDICHMGELIVSGKNASVFLQNIVTRDINKLEVGRVFYTLMCNEQGGCIDDLFVYRLKEDEFMLVVNAINIEKDLNWLIKNKAENVDIRNISQQTAKLDIQGPFAEKTLQKSINYDLSKIQRFHFQNLLVDDSLLIVSRTGYTGEDGFELYFNSSKAEYFWNLILQAGKESGIKPIGLGARDTLRIEACYSLYGHEINETLSPFEAGLSFAVDFNKNFIGREPLFKQKSDGTLKKLVCFEMADKAIPREHYEIFKNNQKIGFVTSGTFSPTFRKPLGMGYVQTKYKEIGQEIEIKIRNTLHKAIITKRPFYSYKGK